MVFSILFSFFAHHCLTFSAVCFTLLWFTFVYFSSVHHSGLTLSQRDSSTVVRGRYIADKLMWMSYNSCWNERLGISQCSISAWILLCVCVCLSAGSDSSKVPALFILALWGSLSSINCRTKKCLNLHYDLTLLCPETGRPCLDQRWVNDDNVVTEAQSSWISADSASKSPLIASGCFLYLVNLIQWIWVL